MTVPAIERVDKNGHQEQRIVNPGLNDIVITGAEAEVF
jgi:hypothetical protein